MNLSSVLTIIIFLSHTGGAIRVAVQSFTLHDQLADITHSFRRCRHSQTRCWTEHVSLSKENVRFIDAPCFSLFVYARREDVKSENLKVSHEFSLQINI